MYKTINKYNSMVYLSKLFHTESTYNNEDNEFLTDNNIDNWIQYGNIRHHPSAIREWDNSVYNYNKTSQVQYLSKFIILNRLLKSYFNINNNTKLARSKRMRYLRIKYRLSKIYISRPEVKQTNDEIIVNVYYYDKIKNRFVRKLFYYNRPKIGRFINNLYKSKKGKISFKKTKLLSRYISYSGIKYIKELKMFKHRNKFKHKFVQQGILLHFFNYILSMLNISVFIPTSYYNLNKVKKNRKAFKNNYEILLEKELKKINKIISIKPKAVFWIDYNNCTIETIDKYNVNYDYLRKKVIDHYNNIFNNKQINKEIRNVFKSEINTKLWNIIKGFIVKNTFSQHIIYKMLNVITVKIKKFINKKIFKKRSKKIERYIGFSQNNLMKMKTLLPVLKTSIDNLYNKKATLNLINLKYFYLNNDIYNKVIITKIRRKINPLKVIKGSMNKIKVYLNYDVKKKTILNNMNKLYNFNNMYLLQLPSSLLKENQQTMQDKDWLQTLLNRLYPYNIIYNYFNSYREHNKVTSILNHVKYKKILGIRVEASGRLTRRNTASKAVSFLVYKGNLKDTNQNWDINRSFLQNVPALLLRNTQRPNTKYIFSNSKKRIGAFGIKTWISSK